MALPRAWYVRGAHRRKKVQKGKLSSRAAWELFCVYSKAITNISRTDSGNSWSRLFAMPYQGECNCGGIKVSIEDEAAAENKPIFCHCLSCRRQSGALGTYVLVLPEGDVTVTGPLKAYLDDKTDSGTSLHRWFCEVCGW
ncbi:hypothetical protein, variant 2 [Exophiala mesophila]|uniref:CENP-V/GFA domain-containing protein n=1 Tax=Exophiala mesophila TaxID=212818 RepID=A0A0D1Z2R4_EXOME|nr:hypothetical protein, variant 1 [Exophiala mesophila]XP_016220607.1 hypothetical protein, variant 2 [Exophiala mesophila]KIV89032.1 hypothetical protein, variant 1 [Exophiala mesophila]KIV89033.1 hypothetical protein, variant 2 [Exophiala mesophila]